MVFNASKHGLLKFTSPLQTATKKLCWAQRYAKVVGLDIHGDALAGSFSF